MKRLLATVMLAIGLSTTVLAGDVPFPPLPPPTCTENCTATSTTDPVTTVVIDLVLTLITFRP